MGKKQAVILVLLDLSAAFDTIDHDLLLNRLSHSIGIKGTVLQWFESYLKSRHQQVSIGGEHSSRAEIKCGVPQGSVLGPVLFTLYMSPLGEIIKRHNLSFHIYADDTQLYIMFKPTMENLVLSVSTLQMCIKEIQDWMLANKLKLNDDKSEVMLLGTRQQLAKLDMDQFKIGECNITVSSSARNLGVMFDDKMTMDVHINRICQIGFLHLRNIVAVRKYLTKDAANSLVHAFVTSRIDSCNSLIYNATGVKKLQYLQNAAA